MAKEGEKGEEVDEEEEEEGRGAAALAAVLPVPGSMADQGRGVEAQAEPSALTPGLQQQQQQQQQRVGTSQGGGAAPPAPATSLQLDPSGRSALPPRAPTLRLSPLRYHACGQQHQHTLHLGFRVLGLSTRRHTIFGF